MGKLDWRNRACAAVLLWATTAIGLSAQTFKTLYSFDGTDGQFPSGALVQATGGNLYGTTFNGGQLGGTSCYGPGCGTIFKITPGGTLTTLYSFCSQSGCTDGAQPYAGLVQATNGNFYGTTQGGGNAGCDYGCGTVFTITPSGTLTTLYSFCSQTGCIDGAGPDAGLLQATDGNFYGTTSYGGANKPPYGGGTVFKITPSGTLTTLHSFEDGAGSAAALIQATDGNFYGTTTGGGAKGAGTVFKITPSGTLTTLYSFCSQSGCTDGSEPEAALVQATNGNFYGTTSENGANGRGGTVFKITPSGTLTTLYSFCSQRFCTDGDNDPHGGLVQATDGNFYGTTSDGGVNPPRVCPGYDGCGTVFKITPTGTLTTLYDFCSQRGCTDGDIPFGLVQSTNGNFYGTTYYGGADSRVCAGRCGTVFSLSVGLEPFVETQPASGRVGSRVEILGTHLRGATSVSFNGTAAVFKVHPSGSSIIATVPEGATTGTVQVVTPGGTLSSNVPFRVLP